jgi:hypothetical protein
MLVSLTVIGAPIRISSIWICPGTRSLYSARPQIGTTGKSNGNSSTTPPTPTLRSSMVSLHNHILAQGGSPSQPKLVFTSLQNGISGVDRKVDGVWKAGSISGTNGLIYNVPS